MGLESDYIPFHSSNLFPPLKSNDPPQLPHMTPPGGVAVDRYDDEPSEQFPARVLEACRAINPQLIVLGSSEVMLPDSSVTSIPLLQNSNQANAPPFSHSSP